MKEIESRFENNQRYMRKQTGEKIQKNNSDYI